MGTLELERHLGAVRRVFLMEAGDIMAEFCTDVFARQEYILEFWGKLLTQVTQKRYSGSWQGLLSLVKWFSD